MGSSGTATSGSLACSFRLNTPIWWTSKGAWACLRVVTWYYSNNYSNRLHSCCKYCCIQLWENITPVNASQPFLPSISRDLIKNSGSCGIWAGLPVCAAEKPAFSFLPCQIVADAWYAILSAAGSRKHPFICPRAQVAPNLNIRVTKSTISLVIRPQTPVWSQLWAGLASFDVHVCGFGLSWVYTFI